MHATISDNTTSAKLSKAPKTVHQEMHTHTIIKHNTHASTSNWQQSPDKICFNSQNAIDGTCINTTTRNIQIINTHNQTQNEESETHMQNKQKQHMTNSTIQHWMIRANNQIRTRSKHTNNKEPKQSPWKAMQLYSNKWNNQNNLKQPKRNMCLELWSNFWPVTVCWFIPHRIWFGVVGLKS